MKLFWVLLMCVLGGVAQAHAADEFDLTVDGETLNIIAGEDKVVTLKDGRAITLRVARKQNLTYEQPLFSFQHPGQLSVTSKEISSGIMQHLLVTATGTMILLQVYDDIEPNFMIKLITREMTEDDVATGATIETQPHAVKLVNGVELVGERSLLKGIDDDLTVDVVGFGIKRGGVLVVTRYDSATSPEDKPLLEQFWSTLAVSKN
jgi:hypothetical protein